LQNERTAKAEAVAKRRSRRTHCGRWPAIFADTSDTGGAKLRTIGQRIAMFERDILPTLAIG